jgi:hypothetical protein
MTLVITSMKAAQKACPSPMKRIRVEGITIVARRRIKKIMTMRVSQFP